MRVNDTYTKFKRHVMALIQAFDLRLTIHSETSTQTIQRYLHMADGSISKSGDVLESNS